MKTSLSISLLLHTTLFNLLMLSLLARLASSFVSRHAFTAFTFQGSRSGSVAATYSSTTAMSATSKPFAVVVQAEIKPERMDEFLDMIKNNAENSRKEPGCVRFGT